MSYPRPLCGRGAAYRGGDGSDMINGLGGDDDLGGDGVFHPGESSRR